MQKRMIGNKPIHQYAYKRPNVENQGLITGIYNCLPDCQNAEWRMCLEITYPDGYQDYVPLADFENGNNQFIFFN